MLTEPGQYSDYNAVTGGVCNCEMTSGSYRELDSA